jgi:hypothetical protein
MKVPKYNNEKILIHCMNREPHTLIFDHDFINYRDFEVLGLCEDLILNFNYLSSLAGNDKKTQMIITIANSLVWSALFYHHNDIIPEYYKIELPTDKL